MSAAPSSKRLLAAAHNYADLAADELRKRFRRPLRVDDKGTKGIFDPVTQADRKVETLIRREIAREWPEHEILGEEYGGNGNASPYRWIIDPIDGTKAFIMGSPMWGVLIGLMHGDAPVLGLMDQPFTRERFWSGPSASYTRGPDGRQHRLKTRTGGRLKDAILTTTHPDLLGDGRNVAGFEALKAKCLMTRYGGDCYIYCLLAAGHVDLVVECGLKPYDIIPLIPIIERAGGVVTDWNGGPATSGGRIVAAGDSRLHTETLNVLRHYV